MNHFWQRWPINVPPASSFGRLPLQHRWAEYYQTVTTRSIGELLLTALAHFKDDDDLTASSHSTIGFAVDLGCGNGRDTVVLLQRQWRVLAIDSDPAMIAQLRQRQDINRTYLETRVQPFEDLTLPPDVDLINASFCLPCCAPSHFTSLWTEIETALRPGGRFCGQLLGNRDSWASYPHLTHHNRYQLDELLQAFEVELLTEEEHTSTPVSGVEEYWHVYHIVARKR